MKGQLEFKKDMLNALTGLMQTYHLVLADTEADEIQIVGRDFAIRLPFVREGIIIIYYDLRPAPFRGRFALGNYLVQVRRAPVLPQSWENFHGGLVELWRYEMKWVIETLQTFAADVLRGDREWQKTYPYPHNPATDAYYAAALATIERERNAGRM